MHTKLWQYLLHRPARSNKYDYGHVLVVGGSAAMTGAPVLAARAALRSGAGLVTIASTADATQLIDRDIEEVMSLTVPSWNKAQDCFETIENFIKERNVSVIVIGPGLPPIATEIVHTLLLKTNLPLVVDAGALTALAKNLSVLKNAAAKNKRIVLTPHTGEYARLLNNKTPSSDQTSASQFAKDYGVTLILKRNHTLVCSKSGEIYKNSTGNPGLATAGTGDVLAGIVAALLAQKIKPYQAAKMAVYLHGAAGDIAAKTKTEPGMIASDIIEAVPEALHKL